MKTASVRATIVALCLMITVGCESSQEAALREFRDLNETNVAKVRTCFMMFASRNQGQTPENQEELENFLGSGAVDKNLGRAGIDVNDIGAIFTSERDGQPLKIRWGKPMSANGDAPVAFETIGVDGTRLVSADKVMEVSSDEKYEALWNGEYSSIPDEDLINQIQDEVTK